MVLFYRNEYFNINSYFQLRTYREIIYPGQSEESQVKKAKQNMRLKTHQELELLLQIKKYIF